MSRSILPEKGKKILLFSCLCASDSVARGIMFLGCPSHSHEHMSHEYKSEQKCMEGTSLVGRGINCNVENCSLTLGFVLGKYRILNVVVKV